MRRLAIAILLTAAAPLALVHAAHAQTAPEGVAGDAPPQAPSPAGDAPARTPADQADRGATPGSGQAEGERREGVTVYQPDFFAASRPNSASEMVNRLPGFELDTGNSARGFAGTAGNVLIDGKRPASKSDSLSDILARIPAAQVERIEVIRGGAPGIDMQGRSVVANVVRRAGDSSQQVLTVATQWFLQSGDNLPSLSYQTSRTVGERSFDLALNKSAAIDDSIGQGQRIRRDASGAVTLVETAGTEADGRPYSARGSVKTPFAGGELRANGSLVKSDFKDEEHFDSATTDVDSVATSKSLTGEMGLNYTRPLSGQLGLELVGLQRLAKSEALSVFDPSADRVTFTSDATSGESIARAVLRLKRSETLSFEGGAEGAFNFRDGRTALTVNDAPQVLPTANVRVEERRGEAFLTATWRPRPSLGVEAGSRFEVSRITASGDAQNERSFFYPKPRLLATWTPTKADTFRLRLEREVGQLNFGDFVASANLTEGRIVSGNIDLEPAQRTVIELTAERRFWDTGSIGVTLAREGIVDAIDRVPIRSRPDPDPDPTVPDIIFDAPGNIGEGTQDELDVNLTLPLGRFGIPGGEFKANLEWVNSEVTDPTTGEARRISGQRPQNFEFQFRQDLPRYKLTYGGTYLDGFTETHFRYNEIFRVKLDNYFQAFVEYKPDAKTSLRAELANIGRFRLDLDREVFEGPRNTSVLSFHEDFFTESQQRIILRVRRTFN